MTNKHMKTFSTPSAIRGIQIKTTMRYHFTHIRIATIKINNNNVLVILWRNWNPSYPAGTKSNGEATMESILAVPQNIKYIVTI